MLCTYDIYFYGWMYYWALCLSTSLKLISVLSKKAWQSNLCIIIPIWESPRGPDTKKYGSCAKILSGSWHMSFPGFWYKLFGVLLQNHRGAATKPPGCCYKNHRGPMPGVSGYQRRTLCSSEGLKVCRIHISRGVLPARVSLIKFALSSPANSLPNCDVQAFGLCTPNVMQLLEHYCRILR